MGQPSRFRIQYAPQQKKQLQARCAFCRKHFKQSKLQIGTKFASGEIQWRHANRKCRAWQYILSRTEKPEDFEGWDQIKALDKRKIRKFFVPKTKARILRRETTVPKIPEDQEAQAAEKEIVENRAGDGSEMNKEREGNNNEDPVAAQANGKAKSVAQTVIYAEGEFAKKYRGILEARMSEITHVFDKGTDKDSLTKARNIASEIVGMTAMMLEEMD